VAAGESLWSICRTHLGSTGNPPSAAAVSEAVQRLARANRIADADFILPGQQLDLSVLRVRQAVNTPLARPVPGATAKIVPAGAGGPAIASNSVEEALWRAKKAALQTRGAVAGLLKPESRAEADQGAEAPFNGLLGGSAFISSGFGLRKDPFTGRMQRHDGIDIAAAKGTEVFALQEGRVFYSGWRGDYGRLVIVHHEDGTETRYGHLSDRLVKQGDTVKAGAVIGKVGSSGRSTGPHLHFEVRQNARPINPLPYLQDRLLDIAQVF
jgi:murein DD-endopeptidase MepM/ murein hydrolase activator NlpD